MRDLGGKVEWHYSYNWDQENLEDLCTAEEKEVKRKDCSRMLTDLNVARSFDQEVSPLSCREGVGG